MATAVQFHDAAAIAAHYRDLAILEREVFVVAGLDAHGRLLCQRRTQGQVGGVAVAPRDVLRLLLLAGAVAFVLVHNHPSGVLAPSAADVAFTLHLAAAARLCGLHLLDHVILAGPGWLSLRQEGILEVR